MINNYLDSRAHSDRDTRLLYYTAGLILLAFGLCIPNILPLAIATSVVGGLSLYLLCCGADPYHDVRDDFPLAVDAAELADSALETQPLLGYSSPSFTGQTTPRYGTAPIRYITPSNITPCDVPRPEYDV